MIRAFYVLALILFTGMYTFSVGSSVNGNDDNNKNAGKKDDDDGDDEDAGGNANKNNYIEVNTLSNLQFSITQPEEFENTQTVHNGIKLQIKTRNSNSSVYAKIADYTTPSGANKNTVPLALKHRQDNSGNVYGLVTTQLQLTYQDQRLFVQPKANQNFNFFYDLQLLPLGYDYPEGQYNFTIMFTMTQP